MGILPALPAEGWLRSDALPISGLLTPQSKGPLLAPIPIPFCLWRGSEAATCQLAVGLSAAGASCLRLGQRCTLLFFLSFFFFQDAAGTFWGKKTERLGLLDASVLWVAVGSGAENKPGCPPLIAASPSC